MQVQVMQAGGALVWNCCLFYSNALIIFNSLGCQVLPLDVICTENLSPAGSHFKVMLFVDQQVKANFISFFIAAYFMM